MFEHRHHPKEKGAHKHHSDDGHHHHHDFRTVEKKRLRIVIVLTLVMMIVELIWGFLSNSLALLSDAFHMLTHFGALAVSLISIVIATRLKSRDKTFGYWRVEILSALFNGITLLPIMAYILYEAYHRFRHPEAVVVSQMLVVALLGLVVNLVCAAILADVSRDDFNLRGAFLHLIGDTASSGGVVVAAIIIHYTSWTFLDPLVSVLIALVILVWSVGLIRESVNILLESVPRGIKLKEVQQAVLNIPAVREIHDVHIWQITSKMYALTAHVGIENVPIQETKEILEEIHDVLDSRYHISHVNIQFEPYNGNGNSEA